MRHGLRFLSLTGRVNMRTCCVLRRVVGSCVGSWLAWVCGYFVFYVVAVASFMYSYDSFVLLGVFGFATSEFANCADVYHMLH